MDEAATKAAYAALPLEIGCTCHTCRNFMKAAPSLPDDVFRFFAYLGVDPLKPSEIYENYFEGGIVHYGGFYHLVGNYISGDDAWQPVTKNVSHQNITPMHKVTENFEIGFTREVSVVPGVFPEPGLQMEVSFTLPWVLDEPYDDAPQPIIPTNIKSKDDGSNTAMGFFLVLCFGTVLGSIAGLLTGEVGLWLAFGIGVGLCGGVVAGIVIQAKNKVKIRPITPAETPWLEDFLVLAIFVPEGAEAPSAEVIWEPRISIYIKDFGQPDDVCFVAVKGEKIIGAAWSRILSDPNKKGYGNIDDHTPELAISVLPEYRSKGIGGKLLTALHDALKAREYARISLSVQKENPAFRLYERMGYKIIDENDEDYIMVKELNQT
ncbi:MAG: GNAT family N-acetyltransferase [Oscillospiraceae bacterium]|nr:GNAT family N-acetyltransferase [Oscillospiraceae bacterium]